MPSIFLSHSSKDKPFVRRLASRLAESGVIVWLDEVELAIGDSLVDKIGDAIHTTDYVAAVISSHSVKSRWVQKELSLALTKEIAGTTKVIIPVVIDDCELPNSLRDKLYADFRTKGKSHFESACARLLKAMGVGGKREHCVNGMSVEWTAEGPIVAGHEVVISSSESNALITRWQEWMPKFIKQEKDVQGADNPNAYHSAMLLAVMRACVDTYHRMPEEEEMKEASTELARKCDLFFWFIQAMFNESLRC